MFFTAEPNPMHHPNKDLIALGIRQPWAELILRGEKTIEVRSTSTAQRGTIYVYASKKFAEVDAAERTFARYDLDPETLPRGLVVGTVDIVDCRLCDPDDAKSACVPKAYLNNHYAWTLANPQRLKEPLSVTFLPYGVWFYPWKRKSGTRRRNGQSRTSTSR